jgi:hypothetical protein
MGTTFATGWDEYKRQYSQNQAYLDCFTENNILAALGQAWGYFTGYDWLLRIACDVGGPNLVIEQGSHQPEKDRNGFCLHFTGRYQHRAYHFYVEQDGTGKLVIFEITG